MNDQGQVLPAWCYPTPSEAALKTAFVGKRLDNLPVPTAVLDVAKVKANCDTMIQTVERLRLDFRAHVKSHKTVEVTKIQVEHQLEFASHARPVRLVASTIAEIEHLVPFMLEARMNGSQTDVLYGVPPTRGSIGKLLSLSMAIESGKKTRTPAVSVLIDDPNQPMFLAEILNDYPDANLGVFIKVDTGYHRAGVEPASPVLETILMVLDQHPVYNSRARLRGLYSHMGTSYNGGAPDDAVRGMIAEIESLEHAARNVERYAKECSTVTLLQQDGLVLAVGATPTVTAVQNLLMQRETTPPLIKLSETINRIKADPRLGIELHAGVYPLLDLQQVATHARPPAYESNGFAPKEHMDTLQGMSVREIAFTVLVEVISVYEGREQPEALISAGTLSLGREPCKSYIGWGVVAPQRFGWRPPSATPTKYYDPDEKRPTGWVVNRVSQEHAILAWVGPKADLEPLRVGEKLLLWPNHACIAGAGFGWYVVVDSKSDDPNIVRDVWVRCRGW